MLASYTPYQEQQRQGYPLIPRCTAAALAARLTKDETACYLVSRGGFGHHHVVE
jgi:hypothetical protein